ncbi:hypothetical protein FKP32DRAFT_210148 [Trametes sanguinea]|nr:hypothetical protein FKP32DRAFT_210148 [Trametes sanguinea]
MMALITTGRSHSRLQSAQLCNSTSRVSASTRPPIHMSSGRLGNKTLTGSHAGSNVIVYGIVSPAFNVAVKCTLDDNLKSVLFGVNGSTTSTELHHYALCRSGTIPYDLHTITVENIGDQLWIDSIQVESLSEPSASTSVVAPTTPAGSSDHPNGQVTTSGAHRSTGNLSPGALGGVIVAGAVAVLLVLVIGLHFRERRQKLRGPRYTTYPREYPSKPLSASHAGVIHGRLVPTPKAVETRRLVAASPPWLQPLTRRSRSCGWTSLRTLRHELPASPVACRILNMAPTSTVGPTTTPVSSRHYLLPTNRTQRVEAAETRRSGEFSS